MRRVLSKELSLSATATSYLSLPDAGGLKWRVVDVRLLSDASISTHASNYYTLALAGSDGTSGLSSWTGNSSGGTALTAGVPLSLSINASKGEAAELDQSVGQSLKLVSTKTGTPSDLTGILLVEVEAVA